MDQILAQQRPKSRTKAKARKQDSNKANKGFLSNVRVFLVGVYSFLRNHPRLSLLSFGLCCSLLLCKLAFSHLSQTREMSLPKHVSVVSEDIRQREAIKNSAEAILAEAKKSKKGNTFVRERIAKMLTSKAGVDAFWIRIGLQSDLSIRVRFQRPALLLEVENGDRYLISNRMKTLEKNPDLLSQRDIPLVKIAGVSFRQNPEFSLNLAWIYTQAKLLQSLSSTWTKMSLDYFQWQPYLGFSLGLKIPYKFSKSSQNPNFVGPNDERFYSVKVSLGEDSLETKINEIQNVLNDLRKQELRPESVDLNYTDKALIRFADQAQVVEKSL